MTSASRLDEVARLERLFAHAPMRRVGELEIDHSAFNGIPSLVELFDDGADTWVRAVHKPASAQLPQEIFAWRAAKAFDATDRLAVTMPRSDPLEGYVVELVPGEHPNSLVEAVRGLRAAHADAERPGLEARIDLHRVLGYDWLVENSDRHLKQLRVSPTGLLGFDHGHIGWRALETPRATVVPMHADLLGTTGERATFDSVVHMELEPAAVERLLAHADPAEIERAHARTLAIWSGPTHPDFVRTSAYAASDQYLDGVLARIEHLGRTGTIEYVNARAQL